MIEMKSGKKFFTDYEQGYEQGRADAYKELAPLIDNIVTMDNICDALGDEWCEKNCNGDTSKCLSRYVEKIKGAQQ